MRIRPYHDYTNQCVNDAMERLASGKARYRVVLER